MSKQGKRVSIKYVRLTRGREVLPMRTHVWKFQLKHAKLWTEGVRKSDVLCGSPLNKKDYDLDHQLKVLVALQFTKP